MIPGSDTDLPPFLDTPRDVYLFVTAGAAFTDVRVAASPAVRPPALARALEASVAGTALDGQTVLWSDDSYAAARVERHWSRLGRRSALNLVPVGALQDGLRRAGYVPHLLLRIPRHARASVPRSHYGTRTFRWYDARRLHGATQVTVRATLPLAALTMLGVFAVVPLLLGLTGLLLANALGRASRSRFQSLSMGGISPAMAFPLIGSVFALRSPYPLAIADLWFGSSSAAAVVPALVIGMAAFPVCLLAAKKRELRLFGPTVTGPTWPMSPEEKTVHQRMALWNRAPHLLAGLLLVGATFVLPRRSFGYSVVHPASLMLVALSPVIIGFFSRRRLAAFTRRAVDQDLTWRARQLGQQMGVRPREVWVEESSRAAHVASASLSGGHITVTQKLRDTFTPAEIEFVLAHHVACMKLPAVRSLRSALNVLILPLSAPGLVLLWARHIAAGTTGARAVLLSPWFLPACMADVILVTALLAGSAIFSVGRQMTRDKAADRMALGVTGDLAAAEGALRKLSADAPTAERAATSNAGVGAEGTTLASRLALRQFALRQPVAEGRPVEER